VASFPQVSPPKSCLQLSTLHSIYKEEKINIKLNLCMEPSFPREADGHHAGQDVPHLSSDRSVPHSQQPVPLSSLHSVTIFPRYVQLYTVFSHPLRPVNWSLSFKCFDKFLYDFPISANTAHSIPLVSALDDQYKRPSYMLIYLTLILILWL